MRLLLPLFISVFILISSGNAFAQVIITEINYNSDSTTNSGNWVELYNKSSSMVDISDWKIKNALNVIYNIPAGTQLNGLSYIVVVQDLVKFNSIHSGVTNKTGPSSVDFGNSGDNVQLLNASSAFVISVNYSDSALWPRGADGFGRTLELEDYNGNQNDGGNWFDGCMFGSPGVAYSPCNPDLVFSELNYNSNPAMDAGDWIEIHNTTSAAINIGGYSLSDSKDSNTYLIPNVTIPAGGYRVLCNDVTKFLTRHPGITNVNGAFTFGFKGKGEAARLYGADGKLKFAFLYDNKLPWPVEADSLGFTLELLDIHGKMDEASNWFKGCLEGSPGVAFDPGCLDGIEETNSTINFSIQQTLVSTTLNINYISNENKSAEIMVVDLLGRVVIQTKAETGMNQLNISNLANGIYLIRLKSGNISVAKKFIKQ